MLEEKVKQIKELGFDVSEEGRNNWTLFNPESKQKRHDETFEEYLAKAYEIGKNM